MSFTDVDKLFIAIENLRNNTELTFRGLIVNENYSKYLNPKKNLQAILFFGNCTK